MQRIDTRLPTFLIIGAMKAGTTALHTYLDSHPHVFMSALKEPHYFADGLGWGKGEDWYRSLFASAGDADAIGESSTSYAKYPDVTDVPARVDALLSGVRIVYVIRHPIERIRSQYLHQVVMGEESEPIDRAVRRQPRYVNYSRYALQLARWHEYVPADRIHLVRSEDLRFRRGETLGRVLRFVGVDTEVPLETHAEVHRTVDKREPRPALRAMHRLAPYRAVAERIPGSIKAPLRRFTTWSVDPASATIDDALRGWLEDALADDVRALRAYLGPSFDGWGIA